MPAPHDDLTARIIEEKAGVGAGRPVARASWTRVLTAIRGLVERDKGVDRGR
jgi:hypothetical protein